MNIKRNIKFFFQRIFRGFDDSETFGLYGTFYSWLLPRLKRFRDITIAYPDHKYPTFESWIEELDKRCEQLEYLIKEDELDFFDDKVAKDFNNWFAENCMLLWW